MHHTEPLFRKKKIKKKTAFQGDEEQITPRVKLVLLHLGVSVMQQKEADLRRQVDLGSDQSSMALGKSPDSSRPLSPPLLNGYDNKFLKV